MKRQDRTLDHRVGPETEKRRYGYHPDGTKDSWVILCTVPGATGPFTETRTVTYTAWEQDPRDPVRDTPLRGPGNGRPAAYPATGYRASMPSGEVVTASPTHLCVWQRQDGRGHVDNLLGGPFPCPPEVRAAEHLQAWYDGWVEAGRPS